MRVASVGLSLIALAACGAPPPSDYVIPHDLEIEIVGEGFQWEVRYPGPDGELGTSDDEVGRQDVHVPLDARTTIHLRSRDYIYTFALPHLGLKEIAVPDLEYALEFVATHVGRFELRGDQMCGFAHPDLIGELVVESRADYVKSLRKLGARKPG